VFAMVRANWLLQGQDDRNMCWMANSGPNAINIGETGVRCEYADLWQFLVWRRGKPGREFH